MTRTDCGTIVAFALASVGVLFALAHATERHELIIGLEQRRSNLTSQRAAAQRMLDNAERELALERDNPQADTIRRIYGGYVDEYNGRLARVETRLSELGAAD